MATPAQLPYREDAREPLIIIDRIHKRYVMGDVVVPALAGVSLELGRGEFVAVMGASGSGKSTLMNILGCLDRPTSGRYLLEGRNVGSMGKDERARMRNRRIGFVFQGFNLLARTSALENVELPLVYAGVSRRERQRRAFAALRAVGLGARVHHHPNQLSGGQQQRVAIARALVCDAPLILADEPTGNLDSRTSEEVMGILQRLNEERQRTIVVVTHEPDIAQYAKRIIVFKDGLIIEDRAVGDRRHAPRADAGGAGEAAAP